MATMTTKEISSHENDVRKTFGYQSVPQHDQDIEEVSWEDPQFLIHFLVLIVLGVSCKFSA